MIRAWLCAHGIHRWAPNGMGGSRPWCTWGQHWHEGWVFCRPCKTWYPPKSAHAMSSRLPTSAGGES